MAMDGRDHNGKPHSFVLAITAHNAPRRIFDDNAYNLRRTCALPFYRSAYTNIFARRHAATRDARSPALNGANNVTRSASLFNILRLTAFSSLLSILISSPPDNASLLAYLPRLPPVAITNRTSTLDVLSCGHARGGRNNNVNGQRSTVYLHRASYKQIFPT